MQLHAREVLVKYKYGINHAQLKHTSHMVVITKSSWKYLFVIGDYGREQGKNLCAYLLSMKAAIVSEREQARYCSLLSIARFRYPEVIENSTQQSYRFMHNAMHTCTNANFITALHLELHTLVHNIHTCTIHVVESQIEQKRRKFLEKTY